MNRSPLHTLLKVMALTIAISAFSSSANAQFGGLSIKNTPFDHKTWRASNFVPKVSEQKSSLQPIRNEPAAQKKIWIRNKSDYPIKYRLNGQSFTVGPRNEVWHRRHSFVIEFDSSFASGFQSKKYKLLPWETYSFKANSSSLDMFRGK